MRSTRGTPLRMTDADTILHVVPLFHVNGWGGPHWMTLAGGRHVMLRKFDPATFLRLVQEERVTHLLGVATIFNAVLNDPGSAHMTSRASRR